MLRRASEGPYLSPSELKARDERKDTMLLLLGAAAIVGFVTLALQLTTIAVATAAIFGLAILRTATSQ